MQQELAPVADAVATEIEPALTGRFVPVHLAAGFGDRPLSVELTRADFEVVVLTEVEILVVTAECKAYCVTLVILE